MKKLFDFVIGNPPFQDNIENNSNSQPIYNIFMDATYDVANKVELITPARFLFNAGQTPKSWNKKMLHDEHFKVLKYESNGKDVFPTADIKGGVAITLRDDKKRFEPIRVFTEFSELKGIMEKTQKNTANFVSSSVTGAVPCKFTSVLRKNEKLIHGLPKSFDLRTNIFDVASTELFLSTNPNSTEYVKIYGLANKKKS